MYAVCHSAFVLCPFAPLCLCAFLTTMFIDAHCHLNMEDFKDDAEAAIERAQNAGVGLMIVVGWDLKSSEDAVTLAEKHDCIYAVCGIHPHDAKDATDDDFKKLRELAQHEKAVAIGETGLDFYKNYSPRDIQEKVFLRQVALAAELNMPLMLHIRDAHDEILAHIEKIKKEAPSQEFIVHCFSGNAEYAKKYQSLGGILSFSGTVTFENAKRIMQSAQEADINRILTETDAPFLTPPPHRGKRNEPSFVVHVAEKCAALKNVPVEAIQSAVLKNCLNAFPKIKVENFKKSA